MIQASGRFDLPFTCCDSTGAPVAPTGTPTGTLVKNGTDLGTTVTVTMSTAQGYAYCTIPSDAVNGDRFYIRISAVISAVTYVLSGPAITIENSVTLPTAPTDWITAAALKADAVTKLQNGLATPTNITAGTITTVTTLTNLPTAPTDWLTAAAVKADAVNKIQVGLATGSQVTALNNLSSLANLFGPTTMEIPDSGSTVFKFTLTVKDQEGLAAALDASPTITVVNASGTSRAAGLSAVSNPATGEYTFTYTVTSADASESLTFKATGTVSAEARSAFWVSSVVDYNALTTIASIAALAQDIKDKTDQLTFTTANVVDASPTPAANIRTAIGLAAANLDTQLSAINDYLDTEVAALSTKLGTPAGASVSADIAAVKTDTGNLVTRVTSTLFSGITSLKNWLGIIAGKTADATTLAEVNATTAGAAYSNLTDSLEAVRDRGDAAWIAGGGGGSTTVVVHPGYASWAEKVAGKRIDVFHNEAGTLGPIRVQSRTGIPAVTTDVDLTDLTGLYFLVVDYLLTEVYTTPSVTISGTENSQFTVPITTALTGTVTNETEEEWHYWSLRDENDTVISTGRLRVRPA